MGGSGGAAAEADSGRLYEVSRPDGADERAARRTVSATRDGGAEDGQPLRQTEREYFEPRLRHDLGAVRIHADPASAQVAERLGAHAVTAGPDIFVYGGRPSIASTAGRALLAHELTHVVQHSGATPAATATVTAPGSPVEREAAQVAAVVASGGPAPPISRSPSPAISRATRDDFLQQQFESQPPPAAFDVKALAEAGYGFLIDKAQAARAASAGLLRKRVAGLPPALQPAGQRVADALDTDLRAFLDLLFFDLGVVAGFAEGLASMVTGAVSLVITIVRVVGDIGLAMIGAAEYALADAGLIASADDSLLQPYGDDLWNAYLLWHEVQYFDLDGFLQTWWENFQQLSREDQAFEVGQFVGELAAFLVTWAEAGTRLGTILPPPGAAPQVAAELVGGGAISVPAAQEGATVAGRLGGPLGGLGAATAVQMAGSKTPGESPPRQTEEPGDITRPVRHALTDEDRAAAADLRDRVKSALDEKWPEGGQRPVDFDTAIRALKKALQNTKDVPGDVRSVAEELMGTEGRPGLLAQAADALRSSDNYANVVHDLELMLRSIRESRTIRGYTEAGAEIARDSGEVHEIYVTEDQSAVRMRLYGSKAEGEKLGLETDPSSGTVDQDVFMEKLSGQKFVDNALGNDQVIKSKMHGNLTHLIHYFVLYRWAPSVGLTVDQFFAKLNLVSHELKLSDTLWVGLLDPIDAYVGDSMVHPEALWPILTEIMGVPPEEQPEWPALPGG